MTIGTPYQIAVNENTTGAGTLVLTLTAAVPQGDMIVIGYGSSGSGLSVSSAANSGTAEPWTIYNTGTGSRPGGFVVCPATVAPMAIGDTITLTWSGTNTGSADAYGVPAQGTSLAVDLAPAGANGFSTAPSGATGTLGHQNELCIGNITNQNAGNQPTSPSWTLLSTGHASGQVWCTLYYTLPGATTATQTCSGTISTNVFWGVSVLTIFATPLGITGAGSLTAPATLDPVAALAGAGTLTAPATAEPVAAITGAGSASTLVTQDVTGTLAGSGSLSAPAVLDVIGAVAGAGSLSAPGQQQATASIAGAGTLTALSALDVVTGISGAGSVGPDPEQEPLAGIAGHGSLTAQPVPPGEPVVTIIGQPGTFGFLAAMTETPTGQSMTTLPVPGWEFAPGLAVFYTRATPDGTIAISTLPFTNNELLPTSTQAQIGWYNPGTAEFYSEIIPTSTGATTAVNPSTGLGGTDTGAGDIALVMNGDLPVILTTQGGYYFGWESETGLYPAFAAFTEGGAGRWEYDQALSLDGDQWEATNPAVFDPVIAGGLGKTIGNGFDYWSPQVLGQMAVLPDGNIAVGHYFGFRGAGVKSGGISVISPAGELLAAYQLPNITPTSGTMTFAAVRDVEADPTSDPSGVQYFAVIFDAFGTGLRDTFQFFSYDHATQVIAPVTVPCCPGDDLITPAFCVFDAAGTFWVTCGSGLSGLGSLASGNTQVYYKHAVTLWNPVAQAPVFPGWPSSSWPTPVQADQSLGFAPAFGLGTLAGPPVIDPQSQSLLLPSPVNDLGISVPQGGGNGPNLLSTFASAMAPAQLLSTNDATFATGLGSWTAFDGFATYDASPPVTPPAVGSLPGAGALQADEFGGGSVYQTARQAAMPSTPYQFTVSFLSQSTARTCGAFVQWYDSGGSLISASSVTNVTDNSSSWIACKMPPQTSPSNAATYAIFAEILSQGSEHHYIAGNSSYVLSASAAGWTGFATNLLLTQISNTVWALELTDPFGAETMSATQPGIAVTPYQEYVLSADFQAVTTDEKCTAQVIWKNSGGGTVSTSLCTLSVTDATSGWATAQCSAMAPGSAATGVVQVLALSSGVGETHLVRNVIFQTQPYAALAPVNYEIGGIRTIYGSGGCGRGCVIDGVFYVPVQTVFTAAESAAYNRGGYVPARKPQFLIAIDLKQVIPADDPAPYLAGQNAASYPVAGIPPPGAWSLPVEVGMQGEGDWLIAVVNWRQPGYGAPVSVSIEDNAAGGRNWWDPIVPGATDSPPGKTMRIAIWMAPAARVPSHVMVAATGYCPAIAATIIGVPRDLIGPWVAVNGYMYAADDGVTELSPVALGAPAGLSVAITGAGGDNAAAAPAIIAGAGWTSLPAVTSSNGVDTSGSIALSAAWQLGAGPVSAQWATLLHTQDLAAAVGSVLQFALPLLSGNPPSWPGDVETEIALGSGVLTPPSELTWTTAGGRAFAASNFAQGRQYTLGQLRAGAGWITLDNADMALIPPGSADFAGIDSGNPFRQLLTFPASRTPYYVWAAGFIQRLPPAWPADTKRGQVIATVTDSWGYANRLMPSMARAEILADGPAFYAPCSDPAGTAAAANFAPGSAVPLAVTPSKYGAAGNSQQFAGQPAPPLLGDMSTTVTSSARQASGGGMWQQTLASNLAGNQGYSLNAVGQWGRVENGLTLHVLFQIAAPLQQAPVLIAGLLKSRPPSGDIYPHGILLWVDSPPLYGGTGKLLLFTSWGTTPGIDHIGIGGTDYTAGAVPPLTLVTITFDDAGYTSYINGQQSSAGTWGTALHGQLPYLTVNGSAGLPWPLAGYLDFVASSYSGLAGQVVIFPGKLPQGRILSHYQAILGLAGESESSRIERLLGAGGLTGRRLILPSTGEWVTPCTSTQDVGGQPAATGLTNIAQSTTPAILAVAPTGAPFYYPRQYTYNQPVQWVLGDDTDAGEYPFQSDYAPDYDPVRVADDVEVTQLDDQSVMVPQLFAAEQAAVTQYGYQSSGGQITGYLQNDVLTGPGSGAGCVDLANWIADVSSKPQMRIAQVTVDAATFPESWPFVAGVCNGDTITVNWRPPTAPAGSILSVTGRVVSTSRDLKFDLREGMRGSVTVGIDTAPELNAIVLGDPDRGQLNGQNIQAW